MLTEILAAKIPAVFQDKYRSSRLCFVDPNDIGIKFEPLRKALAQNYIDFVILLALYMDAMRNKQSYVKKPRSRSIEFVGNEDLARALENRPRRKA